MHTEKSYEGILLVSPSLLGVAAFYILLFLSAGTMPLLRGYPMSGL